MIDLPLGIDQLPSPHGALLRYEGRMVAMLLLNGRQLTVSPPDGDDQVLDLDEREAVVDLLRELRDGAASRASRGAAARELDQLATSSTEHHGSPCPTVS
jgi:hypothetical protein